MSLLGVGIIGCGNISAAYLRLAGSFAGFEIRAVADISADAAKARSLEFGTPAVAVDEMLASDRIEIVVNLTVPGAHFPVSKQILEAGKHVYTEKPLALSLEDGLCLQSMAGEFGLRLGAAPDTFLGGSHQHARACIDGGLLGAVVSGTAHVMNRGMEGWHPNPDFFFLPGGGPILDLGPYYITNLIQMIGPIRRVAAMANSAFPARIIGHDGPRKGEAIPVKTPTTVHALLEFRSGACITLSASWDVAAHRHASMELYGTEGTLFIPDPNFFGGSVEFAGKGGSEEALDSWDHPFGRPNEMHSAIGPLANYRAAGLADMAMAIRAGRPHRCSADLAIHALDAMTSILRSAETGAWIELATRCERPDPLNPDAAAELLVPGSLGQSQGH